MSKTEMPATDVSQADEPEFVSYELAYHVLPTVAEGEVTAVRDRIAALITNAGGTISTEEAPERFDLAYAIDKYLEGKHRSFTSAYFGWMRFELERGVIEAVTESVDSDPAILRHLVIRLSKEEEAMPFYFHQTRAEDAKVTTVEEGEVDIDPNQDQANAADTSDVTDDTAVTSSATDTTTETESADAATDETTR